MEKKIRIITKEVSTTDFNGNPILWRVVFSDGEKTWFGDLDSKGIRESELRQFFQDKGYAMKLIEEYAELYYEKGRESSVG